ncbi:hypothetical protein [Deinococcus sonorensis]|uniref:hypothetical protein n=1 Tax=Deinococcus sonorensis TaxID=309891 RepID=UPI0036D3747F
MLAAVTGAHASGELEVKGYSYTSPLTLADAFSFRVRYQSPPSSTTSYGGDLTLEHRQQLFSARYYGSGNSVQAQLRRTLDPQAGTSSTSATLSYSYTPTPPASGVAFTSLTAYYALSATTSATQNVTVNTGGVNVSARLADTVSSSLTAAVTNVNVKAGDFTSQTFSSALAGTLSYSKDTTSASASPTLNLQGGKVSWGVGLSARTTVETRLTLAATSYLSGTSAPSGSLDVGYDLSDTLGPQTPAGRLTVGATASYSSPSVSFGARVRSVLTPTLTLGGALSYTPATSALTYAADASGRVGGLTLAVNTSVTTAANTPAAFSVSGSAGAQSAPWYGALSASYRRQGDTQSGSAAGTFGYRQAPLDIGVTLALNATPQLSGTADLTLGYAITPSVDLNGTVRYERSTLATSRPVIRYGAGLRYRF